MLVYAKLLGMAAFWGGAFVAGRHVSEELAPFTAAFLRFAIASALLWRLTIRLDGRITAPTERQWLPVLALGLTGVFGYNALFFTGLATVPAGRAAVIVASNPACIALLSTLFFGERLRPVNLAGVALCLAGAVVVVSRGAPAALFGQGPAAGLTPGDLAIFGCVGCWVAYSLVGKLLMRSFSPVASITWSCLTGTLLLAPFALAEVLAGANAGLSVSTAAALGYLGLFGTVVGFTWYYEGVRSIGAARAAVFINFVPVMAIVGGFFLLGEGVDASLALGASMVVAGVFLTNRRPAYATKNPGGTRGPAGAVK